MPRIAAAVTVVIVMGMCIGFNTVRYPAVWKMVARAHRPPRSEQPAPQSQSLTFSKPELPGESASPTALIPDSAGRSGRSFTSASVDPIPFPAELNRSEDENSDESSDEATTRPESLAATTSDDSTRWPVLEDRGAVPYEPSYELPQEPADSYGLSSVEHRSGGYDEPDPQPVEAAASRKYAYGAADPGVREESTPEDRLAGVKRRPLVPVASATRRQYNGTRAEGTRPAEFGPGSRRTERLDQRVRRLPPLDRTAESPYGTQDFTTAADGPIPIYPSTHEH